MHSFQMLLRLYWLCWTAQADLSKKPKHTHQNPTNKTNKNPTNIQPAPSRKDVAEARWRHASRYRGTTAVGNIGNIWKYRPNTCMEMFKNTIWALFSVSHHEVPLHGALMDKTSRVQEQKHPSLPHGQNSSMCLCKPVTVPFCNYWCELMGKNAVRFLDAVKKLISSFSAMKTLPTPASTWECSFPDFFPKLLMGP